MDAIYTDNLTEIINFSHEEAQRLGNTYIGPEHLLLGIIRSGRGNAYQLLESKQADFVKIKKHIEQEVTTSAVVDINEISLMKAASNLLRLAELEAMREGSLPQVDSHHLLLAMLKQAHSLACDVLKEQGITYEVLNSEPNKQTNDTLPAGSFTTPPVDDKLEPSWCTNDAYTANNAPSNPNTSKSKTPALDTFGNDLTLAARQHKLDPVIGRENEIERLAQILTRRKKNNPVLIGDPGVGKSAIVEGLALRIADHTVPYLLQDKRLIALDMTSLVAGTQYRGQFEERLKNIIKELDAHPEIIVFIDEIHTIIGAGSAAGSLDAANMMKPALSRGKMQCIGATTLDEYSKSIEKDGALERRFQKLVVKPTTREETRNILQHIKQQYEEHHHVHYTDEALDACVALTDRYITDRQFPDKAIDAMDEAGSRIHLNGVQVPDTIREMENQLNLLTNQKTEAALREDFALANALKNQEISLQSDIKNAYSQWQKSFKDEYQTITAAHIAEVVSKISGIPVQGVQENDFESLRMLEPTLKQQIIGQDKAIEVLSRSILRNRIGLKDPDKPIGSFMLLGPTGVGKTLLTKKLAEYLFHSPNALIRVDMSEYMEKFSVSRLVGAPPGYVGYEEGGELTEKVRRNPYSIILFDEIEKAHPDVFNLLLQIMDEGRLTDSLGRTVNFKNTVIIMTSNTGTRQLKEFGVGVGYNTANRLNNNEYANDVIKKALKKTFAPEFLNRIDEIVIFNALDQDAILKIVDIELKPVLERISKLGYQLEVSNETKAQLAKEGYDVQYGARPLKRAIQQHVEDTMAEWLMKQEQLKTNLLLLNYQAEKKEFLITAK